MSAIGTIADVSEQLRRRPLVTLIEISTTPTKQMYAIRTPGFGLELRMIMGNCGAKRLLH